MEDEDLETVESMHFQVLDTLTMLLDIKVQALVAVVS